MFLVTKEPELIADVVHFGVGNDSQQVDWYLEKIC